MNATALARALDDEREAQRRRYAVVRRAEARWATLADRSGREAIDVVTDWMRAVKTHARAKGFVLGVSGGVDSTLAALLVARAARASSREILLPDGARDPDGERDARTLADALELRAHRIDIAPLVDACLAVAVPRATVAVRGNCASRVRNALLYAHANAHARLVVGTGDLDETYLGYSSKGTTADLFPICGLHKEEVRALVRIGLAPVDKKLAARLATRPASPGYFKGHDAERELGLPYARIASALDVIIATCTIDAHGVVPDDADRFARALAQSGARPDDVVHTARLIRQNHHKSFGSPALWRPEPLADDEGTA